MKRIILILICSLFVFAIQAEEPDRAVEPRELVRLHDGPGVTYAMVGRLAWQDQITLLERNFIGNWLHIHVNRGEETELQGWIQTGYLIFNEPLALDDLPITSLPDADVTAIDSQSMRRLYEVPVISRISPAMVDVYEQGQSSGNHRDVITKVGDSVSASPVFLGAMIHEESTLNPYTYLEGAVHYFAASTAEESVASRIGMSTYGVVDPLWADADLCRSNESPLACEYRRKKPVVAFILFGPNDVRSMDETQFHNQIENILIETMDAGIIPILMTFSVDPDDALWFQSLNFNIELTDLADEYDVPLINYWAAARALPDYGLDEDGVHLTHSGFTYLNYATGHESYYGVSLLNLLSARMLYEIYTSLNLEFDFEESNKLSG